MNPSKPFSIQKELVWDAYKRVRQNKGACGVDEVSIQDFERNLKDNLYKIWNRMSSGSYFPPPVRLVEIPKKDGTKRPLGIPTVADRIAQMVVKMTLEPKIDPLFHPDSYGYRPKKSAHEALGVARDRCWRYPWVLDVDIQGFFDNIDHPLLMKAIRHHTDSKWILLYVERWLKAPIQKEDGTQIERTKGTPQGGVISPLLANLFLHYAFDLWMRRKYPQVPFERYADDILVHCQAEAQADLLWKAIAERLKACKLSLHPQKTKIVYCKEAGRQLEYSNCQFDFLGYTFRTRVARNRRGERFAGFLPAISNESAKKIRRVMKGWNLPKHTPISIEELAERINPALRGWIGYYTKYHKSQADRTFNYLNCLLVRWMKRKHKRLRRSSHQAWLCLKQTASKQKTLFAHWEIGIYPTTYRR